MFCQEVGGGGDFEPPAQTLAVTTVSPDATASAMTQTENDAKSPLETNLAIEIALVVIAIVAVLAAVFLRKRRK
jgi:hypothetical protein